LFSGFSGYLADSLIVLTSLQVGWALFFVITSALTLPALITIMIRKDIFKQIS